MKNIPLFLSLSLFIISFIIYYQQFHWGLKITLTLMKNTIQLNIHPLIVSNDIPTFKSYIR